MTVQERLDHGEDACINSVRHLRGKSSLAAPVNIAESATCAAVAAIGSRGYALEGSAQCMSISDNSTTGIKTSLI